MFSVCEYIVGRSIGVAADGWEEGVGDEEQQRGRRKWQPEISEVTARRFVETVAARSRASTKAVPRLEGLPFFSFCAILEG